MDGVRKPLIYSAPASRWVLGSVAAIFLVSLTCFFAGIAVLGFMASERTTAWVLALVGIGGTGLTGALSLYLLRDLRGKLGLRVVVDEGTIRLILPAGRSPIHRVATQHVTLPLTAIDAVEARYEAYRSQGMVNLQRAYVLLEKSGERIFLFEERAQATRLATARYGTLAREIAERSGARWRELGMVEGKGGVLGVWGARARMGGGAAAARTCRGCVAGGSNDGIFGDGWSIDRDVRRKVGSWPDTCRADADLSGGNLSGRVRERAAGRIEGGTCSALVFFTIRRNSSLRKSCKSWLNMLQNRFIGPLWMRLMIFGEINLPHLLARTYFYEP